MNSNDANTNTQAADIADYVSRVRSHLSDIDGDEVEEMLDDLENHLRELRADSQASFNSLLGEPEMYAAELRESAGIAPPPPAPTKLSRIGRVKAFLDQVKDHAWVRAVRDFLPELRPAWWVLRGYLLVVLAAEISGQAFSTFPFPSLWGSELAGLIATGFAVVASIRWGRSGWTAGWKHFGAVAAGALAIIGGFVATASANAGEIHEVVGSHGPIIDLTILPANIYAYTPDGVPLGPVLLYNEAGRPIRLPQNGFSEQVGLEFETTYPVDSRGFEVDNLYPREMVYLDWGVNGLARRPAQPPTIGLIPVLPDDNELPTNDSSEAETDAAVGEQPDEPIAPTTSSAPDDDVALDDSVVADHVVVDDDSIDVPEEVVVESPTSTTTSTTTDPDGKVVPPSEPSPG